jgi:hypothetical protein
MAEARLVDPNQAAGRGADARRGDVQCGHNKLRGCDLVALSADDIAPGYAIDRATVRFGKEDRSQTITGLAQSIASIGRDPYLFVY